MHNCLAYVLAFILTLIYMCLCKLRATEAQNVFTMSWCLSQCPVPNWTRPQGKAGESITRVLRRRHHMTARGLKLSNFALMILC